MNRLLAQIYGTAPLSQEELIKQAEAEAEAEIVARLMAEMGLDPANMSPEEFQAKYQEILSTLQGELEGATAAEGGAPAEGAPAEGAPAEGSPTVPESVAGGEEEAEKEASALLLQYDYLGRVAAHAFANEMRKIAQEGGLPEEFIEQKSEGEKKPEEEKKPEGEGEKKPEGEGEKKPEGEGEKKPEEEKKPEGECKDGEPCAENKEASPSELYKKSSPALYSLGEARAVEFLANSGINPKTGMVFSSMQEKTAAVAMYRTEMIKKASVDEQVGRIAAQILIDNGYGALLPVPQEQ